jgi:arylsulfatase A-like enzyme/cytochrome c-type biogenesis protein CcmH/NrfG
LSRAAAKTWGFLIFLVVLVPVLVLVLVRVRGRSRAGAAPRDNVLLVTLDTTRADRIGVYGHAAARTPNLDRLARAGARFDACLATAPLTLPSHASLLTGLLPPEHGVRNNGTFVLAERHQTVAGALRGQGYTTAAFVSSFVLDHRYGLGRGFEVYDDAVADEGHEAVDFEAQRRGDRTAEAFGAWLEARRSAGVPFFAWLHLYDPHEPYAPPSPYRESFVNAPYDGEIAFADDVIGSAIARLERLGLADRTLVIVVGDHGESLGDHGEETHSMFVYEAALRVPLILWRPGRVAAGRVVTEPVSGIDVAPTILDLVGAPPLPAPHARSLVPLVEGRSEAAPRAVYSETLSPQLDMGWAPLRAVRDERFKLIEAPQPELYDLRQDPAERQNLYAAQPQTARALEGALARIAGAGWGAMAEVALDAEAREKLSALGYVGSKDDPPRTQPQGATDPKDAIATFNDLRHASTALREGRAPEALAIVARVRAHDPGNAFALYIEGSARMQLGRYAEAVERFKAYLALRPRKAQVHHLIALCLLKQGQRDAALGEADAALALEPHLVEARVLRARVLQLEHRLAEAAGELRVAIADDPAKPVLRSTLARILLEAGRPAEARAEYESLLALAPEYAPGLTGLGMLLAASGDGRAAEPHLRKALAVDARQHAARFVLAQILEQTGRGAEAAAEYRRLAEPGTPPQIQGLSRRRLDSLR